MTDAPIRESAAQSDTSTPSRLAQWWDSDFMYSFRHAPVAMVSFVVVVLLVLAAVFAPLIAPYDPFNPATLNLMNGFTPPGEANAFTGESFFLGTDDQGRDVLAVPGHPFDPRSSGCNMLIRDGGTLVRGADDVIEVLNSQSTGKQEAPKPQQTTPFSARAADLHKEILARLGPTPVPEDQLIRDLACDAAIVSPEISTLEVEGKIMRQAGGLLALASKS